MNDDPFFVSRGGEVWACWLNGKPAINLGSEQNFWAAAEKLFNELNPSHAQVDKPAVNPKTANTNVQTEPADRAQKERDELRYDVTVIGKLYGSRGSREVTIFDLSTRGCRIEDYSGAPPGSLVTIKIGAVGPIAAVVRWRRDHSMGLKFEDPLYPAVLENIRKQYSLR
ncbi:PilZ domain-containing protein [Aurantiacibacter zhengii]|uniref:PilZ domain-containing protein n=1 Tax=Aurantiacibacter zhengii TaxID=2307003 RepID=A0A418NN22_9SPHN|nr:PilZ domain-containing protein [Aurantiacibacter zhengii]RIV83033.1 PilZ domain-containing protein [Aurantiacibacter zhengii]